jgi:hypothetical protein
MIILTNKILIIGVTFSMVPRAEAATIHCTRDEDCLILLKNCRYYRVCGPQDTCICYRKGETTPKVDESTPVLINKTK